ncbi:hypothetical protein KAI58_02400 [Candidatus Gracilibacteria bacterium]|nr:hypothetical protein [Candidatus Gracilibacteria bacterium]
MKIGQILLAFILGFLIFIGILVSESARFSFFSKIKNPFESAEVFNQKETIGMETKSIFTKKGEFLRLYPGSEVDFSEGKREIISGEVFISTQFIRDADFRLAIGTGNFLREDFKPKVSQYRVGPILLNAPGVVIFVARDKVKQISKIYAYDHSIDIFFPGSEHPFILPPGMFVTIKEDLISEKTAKLYYTKLKKELNLRSFSLKSLADKNSEEIEDKISISLKKLRGISQLVEDYSKKILQTWSWFKPASFSGKFIKTLKELQKTYSVGYQKERVQKLIFQEYIADLVNASYAVSQNEKENAENYLEKFSTIFKTNEWYGLMYSSSEYGEAWNDFERAQKAWLRTIFLGEIEQVFVDFWFNCKKTDAFSLVENYFNTIETLVGNRGLEGAREKVEEMISVVRAFKADPLYQVRITKTRRLLTELLRNQSFFQEKEAFEVYILLAEKELKSYEDKELVEELTLEIAQDMLFFLKKFLDPDFAKPENSRLLVEMYRYLKIDTIAKSKGRQIFSEEELETVALVSFVGNSGLTKDEIKAIGEQMRRNEEYANRLKAIEEKTEPEKQETISHLIQDEAQLLFFLESLGVNISSMKIFVIGEGDLLRFEKGRYSSESVSGTFQLSTQTFKIITIGMLKGRMLGRYYIKGFLSRVEEQVSIDNQQPVEQTKIDFIQETKRAILERTLVRELFKKEGFTLSRDNIKILDINLVNFELTDIHYKDTLKLSFTYFRTTNRISDVVVENGRNQFELDEDFILNGFGERIEARMIEVFKEKNSEE